MDEGPVGWESVEWEQDNDIRDLESLIARAQVQIERLRALQRMDLSWRVVEDSLIATGLLRPEESSR